MKSLFCCCRNKVAPEDDDEDDEFDEDDDEEDELVIEEVIEEIIDDVVTTLKVIDEEEKEKGIEKKHRTFKSVAQLIRSGTTVAKKTAVKRKITLKSVAKSARMGAATTGPRRRARSQRKKRIMNTLFRIIRLGGGSVKREDEIPKPRKRFKSIGRLATMTSMHANTCEKKTKKGLGFKLLARMSRLAGVTKEEPRRCTCCPDFIEGETDEERVARWADHIAKLNAEQAAKKKISLKSLGRLLRLRARSGRDGSNGDMEEKPKKKRTFRSIGKILRLGASASRKPRDGSSTSIEDRPKKKFRRFKTIGKLFGLGKSTRPGTREGSFSNGNRRKSKHRALKAIARLLRLRSAKPRRRRKSLWTVGKFLGFGKKNKRTEEEEEEDNSEDEEGSVEVDEDGKTLKPPRWKRKKKKWYEKDPEAEDTKELFKLVNTKIMTPIKVRTASERASDRKKTWKTLGQVVLLGTKGMRARMYFARKKKIWKSVGKAILLGVPIKRPRRIKTFKALGRLFVAAAAKLKVKRRLKKMTFKGLSKLSRVSLFRNRMSWTRPIPPRPPRKKITFKAVGNATRLGIKPTKAVRFAKSISVLSDYVKRKFKFKTVANLSRLVAKEDMCTCEPLRPNEIIVCTCPLTPE